jgi:MSHA biogenesis protein MshP
MSLHGQRGMSLVAAIFVVVIVASLAAFAVTTTRATRDATTLQLRADRALAAARAGAEWGVYRALPPRNVCPASQALNLTQVALRNFNVTVNCVRTQPEGTYWVVDITSTASVGNFGAPDYAYRRVVTRFDTP